MINLTTITTAANAPLPNTETWNMTLAELRWTRLALLAQFAEAIKLGTTPANYLASLRSDITAIKTEEAYRAIETEDDATFATVAVVDQWAAVAA